VSLTNSVLDYPLDIRRKIDRKWQQRVAPVRTTVPKHAIVEAWRCALCHAPAPITPIRPDYLGAGVIHHHWLCAPCGQVWTTAVRMPS
jgi:hypothetical protein